MELFSLQLILIREDFANYESEATHMLRHPTGDDVLAHAAAWLDEVGDIDTLDIQVALNQIQHKLEVDHDDTSEQLGYFEDGESEATIKFNGGYITVKALDLVE